MHKCEDFIYTVASNQAAKVALWFAERQGCLLWGSEKLSDPGREALGPKIGPDGKPAGKPAWWCHSVPKRETSDPSEIGVYVGRELKRFHVGTRVGAQGMCVKVTDAGTKRINNAVELAEETHALAWYEFDYGDEKNAVIMVADELVPLDKWPADGTHVSTSPNGTEGG